MKKSVFILSVAALAAGLLFLNTSGVQAQTLAVDDVKNIVIKAIDYPEDAIDKNLQGEVVVSFTTNEQGKLEVNEIFSRIPELQEYVYEKISSIELPQANNEISDPILLRFTFRLI